jgi:hypothetical protein
MSWWTRAPGGATLGVCAWLLFAACGGRSDGDDDGALGTSGTNGCVYDGVHYEVGEILGPCDNCSCSATGSVNCQGRPCEGRAGSSGSGGGAGNGSGGSGKGGSDGGSSDAGGSGGARAGAGGLGTGANSGTTGSNAGQSGGGVAGEGGAASDSGAGGDGGATMCELAEIARFCVEGIPIDSGEAFMEGMPLRVSFQPAGCHSSSCTRVVESACNYLGMNGEFAISGFVCLESSGDDACTDDCGGGYTQCEPGIELTAGDYEITLAPAIDGIRFSVPSVVTTGKLCWTGLENQAP